MRKLLAVLGVVSAALIFAPSANAVITEVLDGDLTCGVVTTEGNVSSSLGQRWCGSIPASVTGRTTPAIPTQEPVPPGNPANPAVRSTHKTFDGVPLDVNVAFPADPNPSPDTDWPVVGMYHGYGGSKMNFNAMQRWLDKGYAVISINNRGSGESCKNQASINADPTGCAKGYVHLMDPRFEIRDAQDFLGELVDQNVVDPVKIAATGGSYGGSESMWFGILRNRMMNPDGTLVPWTSPLGASMSTTVATPNIPWTDLLQSLAPNGDALDYLKDGKYNGKMGIMKESYVQGLFASARNAPIGTDPDADLAGWYARLNKGEPYPDAVSDTVAEEMTKFHSSYYGDHSIVPAPMLMSPGFTDDLFPVDEVLRYYNRTKAEYPGAKLGIFAGSFGHSRGQNQNNVSSALRTLENDWVDFYMKGIGTEPESNVVAYTQTCPNGTDGNGPYTAADWASLAPGELVLKDTAGPRTIAANGGDPATSTLFNPLGAGVNACTTASDAVDPGSATYNLDPAPAGGYTVLGAATVIAKITVANGPNSQIAARLVDLAGAGDKTLISRGSWRPDASGFQVFQLHPGAWKVEEGHTVRLELLPKDAKEAAGGFLTNYARPSNSQYAITVDKLALRVPVLE
ncbi:MAG: prolyl oligopeptidase family serine peptidase, partial [Solirubrobacterales bacterium]